MGIHWELKGNTLRTRENGKKQGTLSACLGLPIIGCMKFLFPKEFCHHFWPRLIPLAKITLSIWPMYLLYVKRGRTLGKAYGIKVCHAIQNILGEDIENSRKSNNLKTTPALPKRKKFWPSWVLMLHCSLVEQYLYSQIDMPLGTP
jgi:hypothetical protein